MKFQMIKKSFFALLFLSLKTDFVLIYRISLIGILVAGSLFIKFSIDQEKQKITEEVFVVAEEIENLISYNIDYLKYQIHYATKQIKDTRANLDDKKMEKILSSFVGNINNQIDISIAWNAFSWVNKNNNLSVDGAAGIIKNPIDLSNRDYLKITSKIPNQLIFGKAVSGALSDRLIIPVAMGVFSDYNAYLGTLVFGLDIERILAKIEKNIGNETFRFALINDTKVAFTSNNFDVKKLVLAQNLISKLNTNKSEYIISSQDLFAKNLGFIGLKNFKNSPLSVLVFYNTEKSHQQLFNLFLKQSFLVLLVIFALIVLFQKIYRKIIKPTSDLSQLASKISKRDFSFTIDKPSGKELIELFNTLNSLKEVMRREEILLQKLELANFQLSKTNQAKVEFLAKSSHELKNYIYAISGLSKLVLSNQKELQTLQSEELQMVETISEQSEELLHFVEDLLDTNQIESGEFTLKKIENYSPKKLINRIILLNKSLAIQHQISLKTNFEENLPLLRCDVRRMKQILANLISNAIKYSQPQSVVVISCSHVLGQNKLCIEIADQGIGMDADELKMFLSESGKNIDKSDLQNVDSYGIGIPIVFRLVELQGGKIEVVSKKNIGTTIKLFFESAPNLENDKNYLPQNKKILIVDDNLVNLKITTKILQSVGYQTKTAQNGKEVLKILDQENFDLILMDGEMPIMNGFEATKKIRDGKIFKKFKQYQTIPIIALMANSNSQLIENALDCGMNICLEKSISKDNLLATIQKFLSVDFS
jgi:signal transduction histidine kinase/CheY-like chemotaxis protein